MADGVNVGLWSRLLRWRSRPNADASVEERDTGEIAAPDESVVALPSEPFVFECQSCGKVFEARRRRPQCPECDSPDVMVMSE